MCDSDSYETLLLNPAWLEKRELVLKRDHYSCSVCRRKQSEQGLYTSLNIHHKVYYSGRLPWEYDDSDLITLCQACHFQLHKGELRYLRDSKSIILNWKELNPNLKEPEPKPYYIEVQKTEHEQDFMKKSYNSSYYKSLLFEYRECHDKNNVTHSRLARPVNVFLDTYLHLFLTISEAIDRNDYIAASDFLGFGERTTNEIILIDRNVSIRPILIVGAFISINLNFSYNLVNSKNEVLTRIVKIGNEYKAEPATAETMTFFIEKHNFRNYEYIIENRIINLLPFIA